MTPTSIEPPAKESFKEAILRHLDRTLGTNEDTNNINAWWRATCLAANEHIFSKLHSTHHVHAEKDMRAVNYLSVEYLMGRLLLNNLHNLGLFEAAEAALGEAGLSLTDICEEEPDMALGNGGLGRLAACFLDSLATLDYPAVGYGIHYEHGLFRQEFFEGQQIERPDSWREYGNPWEVCRPHSVQHVSLYGYVETVFDDEGNTSKVWHPGQIIRGVPWDIPIVGYDSSSVNVLRLWESRATEHFDWHAFNAGSYQDAQREQNQVETISKVLYPNDDTPAGKELRFIQQYFFCSCSIKDIIRRYRRKHKDDWSCFAEKNVIQLNDTHPTLAILELMHLLIDEYEFTWADAWDMCQSVFAYTNHTLLPEALEKWPVDLLGKVLPRHLELLYEINEYVLNNSVAEVWPDDQAIRSKLSVIEEGGARMVRMANLCVMTAFKVNGVAQIHSQLVKRDLFPEFNELWPDKFINVTNGVTPRRWLKACNPGLSQLIDAHVEGDWAKDLDLLKTLVKKADDPNFQKAFMDIKHKNKCALAELIQAKTGIKVSADAIFDVQIKRLHEYKRQHLNFLHILSLYHQLLADPTLDIHPRVFIFGAKAAPGYKLAKDIIYAINKLAERVNNDQRIKDKLKVVFLPNYKVSLAEKIIPATDVSEQISTAGKEASGTGNMKLALNGAVTVGTLDGANIEIAEEVGDDNIFIFGHTVDSLRELNAKGYDPRSYYESDAEIKFCLDWLDTDYFTPGKPGELAGIKHSLIDAGDPYRVLADFRAYVDAQAELDKAYRDKEGWARMAIINTASVGKFNSDRSIQDYVDQVWQLSSIGTQ